MDLNDICLSFILSEKEEQNINLMCFLTLRGNPMERLQKIKIYCLLYSTILYYFYNEFDG